MNDIPPTLPSPDEPKSSPVLALCLGLLPSAMLMLLIAGSRGKSPTGLLVGICIASVICCFVSSFLLFKRRTGAAIAGGVLLMVLNGFIAFFCGCAAMLSK